MWSGTLLSFALVAFCSSVLAGPIDAKSEIPSKRGLKFIGFGALGFGNPHEASHDSGAKDIAGNSADVAAVASTVTETVTTTVSQGVAASESTSASTTVIVTETAFTTTTVNPAGAGAGAGVGGTGVEIITFGITQPASVTTAITTVGGSVITQESILEPSVSTSTVTISQSAIQVVTVTPSFGASPTGIEVAIITFTLPGSVTTQTVDVDGQTQVITATVPEATITSIVTLSGAAVATDVAVAPNSNSTSNSTSLAGNSSSSNSSSDAVAAVVALPRRPAAEAVAAFRKA